MAMGCFDCHDYVDGYNRGRVDGAIEALEKLEREFSKICKNVNYYDCDLLEYIKKQISDLKGDKI